MTEPKKPDPGYCPWRVWGVFIFLDSVACGCVFVLMSWMFVESGAGRIGEEGDILAATFQSLHRILAIGGFLGMIKLSICPQYWVLLFGLCRGRCKLHGGGAVRVTATLLRCFLLAYPLAFLIFFTASLAACDSLFDCLGMVARYWYDWDYNLGLMKPSALFSAFVTGPIMAVLFARST